MMKVFNVEILKLFEVCDFIKYGLEKGASGHALDCFDLHDQFLFKSTGRRLTDVVIEDVVEVCVLAVG